MSSADRPKITSPDVAQMNSTPFTADVETNTAEDETPAAQFDEEEHETEPEDTVADCNR